MNRFLLNSLILLLTTTHIAFGQQVKKAEAGNFLIKNTTIHTITQGTIKGDILIEDGRIANVGSGIVSKEARVIDGTNKHVYPGMIDSGSRLGLQEIGSISLTKDFSELGDFVPQMKALTAVNPYSVSIPVTRVNGVTTVFAKPQGGTFPGTGAVIDLFGYTPEQMSAGAEGVIMQFPSTGRRHRWDSRTDEDISKDAEKAIAKINDMWNEILAYKKIDSIAKATRTVWDNYNPQMQAMMPVAYGKNPLFIEVNAKNDIEAALQWVKDKNIKAVFMGVSEGWRIADKIAQAGIPVITGPVLDLPGREYHRYDASYTNAGIMTKAGVKVAIRTNDAENTRNLPFNAGFAAAYGMGVEEALKAVTIHPAQIFGIDKMYGSIEKGKVANLVVATGDLFETSTQIDYLFIRGWNVPLESRHTLLNDEFSERTPGLK